jgi:hypothetical protein
MRPVAPLGLLHSVQVCNYHLTGGPAAHGFCVIAHGIFIYHIPMAQQAVA